MSYWFSSQRDWATPHLNVHYCLLYASDKFIKNTIWNLDRTPLCAIFPVFPFPPLSYWNFCPNLCHFVYKTIQPKSSILCLSLSGVSLPPFSYTPITIACAMSKRQRGTAWVQITFPPPCTQQFCSNKLNLLLLNAKVAY